MSQEDIIKLLIILASSYAIYLAVQILTYFVIGWVDAYYLTKKGAVLNSRMLVASVSAGFAGGAFCIITFYATHLRFGTYDFLDILSFIGFPALGEIIYMNYLYRKVQYKDAQLIFIFQPLRSIKKNIWQYTYSFYLKMLTAEDSAEREKAPVLSNLLKEIRDEVTLKEPKDRLELFRFKAHEATNDFMTHFSAINAGFIGLAGLIAYIIVTIVSFFIG